MPQLGDALRKAGLVFSSETWPSEELRRVALNAMVRHADDMEATQQAIMRSCRNDAALLRDLLLPWWRQATASIIAEVRRDISAKARREELQGRQERAAARVVELHHERELAREKREREEQDAENARLSEKWKAETAKWMATKAAQLSIDGVPWWRVTVVRGRAWVAKGAHDVRFMQAVLSGLPEDGKRAISHYRRPEEVNALWDAAFSGRED